MSQSKSKLARALETIADLRRQLKEKAGTPSSTWAAAGEPDPHGDRYNCERADLTLGDLTDDQLANGAFMNYDRPLDIDAILSKQPDYHSPIAWMTAVKDRIRWLSRKLEQAGAENRQDSLPYPVRVAPHIDQFAEGVFVWYDEAALPGGAECNLVAAKQALAKYGESLNGPDYPDGCDNEGFPGGSERMSCCKRCGGCGSDDGQMHSNGVDEPEYEPYRCEACDGIGRVPTLPDLSHLQPGVPVPISSVPGMREYIAKGLADGTLTIGGAISATGEQPE